MGRKPPPESVPERLTMVVTQTVYQGFSRFSSSEAWSPPINVYQLPDRLVIAVDLAGIERDRLNVHVEPGRLVIRGERPAPDPEGHGDQPMRILTMEIDYGPFARVLAIPETADLRKVGSEYRNGMLWITLPVRP